MPTRSNRPRRSYVLCLSNEGYAASLETRKVYVALPDVSADDNDLIRVVDESGEDYLYPRARFVPLKLPREIEEALAGT
jgi:hypothetical protein